MHVAHFFAEDLERVVACREVVRPAEREARRGMVGREERPLVEREEFRAARWELVRPVEAHVGTAATRRHSATTSCRIIMIIQSAVCAAGNRARLAVVIRWGWNGGISGTPCNVESVVCN